MDDVELANVIAGTSNGPIWVGWLPSEIAAKIRATDRRVWLSEYTINKNKIFHQDIVFYHYKFIPSIIRHGFAAISPGRKRHVVFGYARTRVYKDNYKLVLKASKDGTTVTVETFHRIKKKEFGRLLRQAQKNCTLIINPYEDILRK